ncbi:hypothetical protein [Amphiplicatus metriothermophilus]|uniref:Uncharacterized protein n=1 Tax=Amphiplicatus metriothermophilus TaxID=1519374 RepID=A0A239PXR4_9PROT|nr:hypothetical protein [Amphiplicatus metriothermophilus]MBB5519979.1 hypothetical protein [Amphiplicatus metriothermophilus]SNT74878.1 hypothetical protein SAMN06297382_2469 [Amphiplicatus metriothermophilus]
MLRSLLAVIVAVIAGLAVAKLVESAGLALRISGDGAADFHAGALIVGWGLGAFVAAFAALLMARRWAPVGWLAAATILFQAVMTLMNAVLPLWAWLGAVLTIGAGGWAAIRLTKASHARPPTRQEPFA